MTDITVSARETIAQLAEPLRVQLSELDAEIAAVYGRLLELREARRNVARTLDYIEPPKKKEPKKATTVMERANPQTMEAVMERLREMHEQVNGNGGFTVASLRRDFGFGDISQSTMQKTVAALHETGALRLDHRGRGGAHYFKVVV